jgi:formylglycine-generating enzyme required for sulfatase activity
LSKKTGKPYRLLSEAEWECAARAGSQAARFRGAMADRACEFENGAEWVEDWYNKSYEGAPTDGRAWTTADSPRRVLRGGNWSNSPGAFARPTAMETRPRFTT